MSVVKKGSTDVTRYVLLVDSTAGTPETAYTITNLDLQYTRNRTAPAAKVDATALAATNSAHGDNQAIEVDSTSSPGLYRVDWPDAAFATGADKVLLVVSGSGLHPAVEEIQLVNYDPEDAVRLGLTALPNAAADAAGGLPISDAGGLDMDAILADTNELQTDWVNGGRLDLLIDAILADTAELQTDWVNGGRLDLLIDAILADTAELQTDWVNGGRLDLLIDAILADTNELQTDWTNGGRLDLIIDDILTDTGTTLQGEVDGIQADTEDIQARLPAALTAGGNIKADALAIDGSTTAATNLKSSATVIYVGTVGAGATTTTLVDAGMNQSDNDHWNGRIIIFLTGNLKYQATDITDFVAATDTLTFTAVTQAPAQNDTFVVL